jgi:hypothetical protein
MRTTGQINSSNLVPYSSSFVWSVFCFVINVKRAEELDSPAVSALRRTIVEVKQRWSVIGWVTKKNIILRSSVLRKAH